MAEIILPIVVEKLASLIQDKIGLLWGVSKEMENLTSTFSTIQAVLEDAERRQHLQQDESKSLKDWLRKLKNASYEVDDILDDCATEANRLESGSGKEVRLSSLTSYPIVGNIRFRHKIGNRMRDIVEKLDKIADERAKYHLRDNILVEKRGEFSKARETGSFLTEPQVLGRDEDKEKIIKTLISDVADCEYVSVYPIIGMGGLGKTTLAQFVYNDERVASHFEKRIWVCVSDDFEQTKVLKAIIGAASGSPCEDNLSLDALQTRIREMLNGKRYLLVLDDVWNEDQEKWNQLKGILKDCGSRGASIITTTRLPMVASIMGTLPPHQLKVLCEDDCWLLFKQRAFGSEREEEEHLKLVAIGKEIVKKCGGVPLAAKTLGSLLLIKREERQWLSIRDSEIWKLNETAILPALRLSYYNLPLELRRCFAYCAMYEKDERIEKDDLIHLWMANGFISSKQDMEDIGNEIWTELYMRSFFQDVEEDKYPYKVTFKMHDLVHDLAQSVMEEECQIVEVSDERPTDDHMALAGKRVRHLNLIARSKPLTTIPKELHIVDSSSLRTLMCTEKQYMTNSPELLSIFENYGTLRAFATSTSARYLASSIGGLKHLRYLRLGGGGITTLPDSICNLWNLQTLNLGHCFKLPRLPEKLRCLKKLRHLITPFVLIEMPPFIGELTCLKTLNIFVVEKRRGCGLDELQHLKLGGSLFIRKLERVGNWMDAKKANLIAKENLHSLVLFWVEDSEEYDSQENVEQLLEALQPPPNLKTLVIDSFKGAHFPLWMESLTSLRELRITNCPKLTSITPNCFRNLTKLQYLTISGCPELAKRYKEGSGEDWHMIAHIPRVDVW